MNRKEQIYQLEKDWNENLRWENVDRPYSAKDVVNLRGQVNVEYTLAKKIDDKHLQSTAYSGFAIVCQKTGDFKKSIDYHNTNIKIKKSIKSVKL